MAKAKDEALSTAAMEEAMQAVEFDSSKLQTGLVSAMLAQIQHHPKPWTAIPEEEQRDIIAQLDNAARHFIGEIVTLIRANGQPAIRGLLEKYTDKGDIVATLKISKFGTDGAEVDVIGVLHKAVGKYVLLTPASAEEFNGGGDLPEAMPDAPGLVFETEGDEAEF
jgi:hypothetical protein